MSYIWLLLGFPVVFSSIVRSFGETLNGENSNDFSERRALEAEATERMEAQMLQMLGLPKRPRPRGNATAPQFMWDMYNLMNEHTVDHSTEVDREGQSSDCVYLDSAIPGNVVRSFPCKVRRSHSRARMSYQTDWVLEFNLTSIKPAEKLTRAHLRLESLINLRPKTLDEYFQLTILSYHGLEKTPRRDTFTFKELMSNQTPDATEIGVDVLSLVQHWRIDNEDMKHALSIFVQCLPSVKKRECEKFMGKLRRPVQQSVNLVTVSMEGRRCKERTRRSANGRSHTDKSLSNLCQRHSLYVGFRDVGWDDWIIAPTGYQAYYCAGNCRFPIGQQQNGTNHAVIQTLVKRLNYRQTDNIPDVCCAPVRLSPISLLFFDDNNNVVLRRYDDMIVDSCGCR